MDNEKKICPLCIRAKEHAKKHGNSPTNVTCWVHRTLNWISDNAYHQENVSDRNPISADAYIGFEEEDISEIFPDNCPIIIAKGNVYRIDNILLQPVIVADIKNGEYVNRQFAIYVSSVKGEGLIFNNIQYFFEYCGYSSIRAIVNTCTWGELKGTFKVIDYALSPLTQRVNCEKCLNS